VVVVTNKCRSVGEVSGWFRHCLVLWLEVGRLSCGKIHRSCKKCNFILFQSIKLRMVANVEQRGGKCSAVAWNGSRLVNTFSVEGTAVRIRVLLEVTLCVNGDRLTTFRRILVSSSHHHEGTTILPNVRSHSPETPRHIPEDLNPYTHHSHNLK